MAMFNAQFSAYLLPLHPWVVIQVLLKTELWKLVVTERRYQGQQEWYHSNRSSPLYHNRWKQIENRTSNGYKRPKTV